MVGNRRNSIGTASAPSLADPPPLLFPPTPRGVERAQKAREAGDCGGSGPPREKPPAAAAHGIPSLFLYYPFQSHPPPRFLY
ncbi:hypothetical protein E2562_013432 [Oryza meyeriana var. granulata]|uniref:Uncharacterized protein n=1 Tax=Oryza meyeriana var. granulata TaxID=110450 RepID=A0A6G1E9A8_9ORYZ|nr:hypothetical protein E2562_013432 [Oryza meyeriana var. granulata]